MATLSTQTYHHSKRKNTWTQWLHPVCQPTIMPGERIHGINGYTQYANLPSCQEKEYIESMATQSMPTYHHARRKNTWNQWLHPVCQPTIMPGERIHGINGYTSIPTYHHAKRKNTWNQWLHPVSQPTIMPRERIHRISVLARHTLQRYCHVISKNCNVLFCYK